MMDAKRLKGAPKTVAQVKAEKNECADIPGHINRALKDIPNQGVEVAHLHAVDGSDVSLCLCRSKFKRLQMDGDKNERQQTGPDHGF